MKAITLVLVNLFMIMAHGQDSSGKAIKPRFFSTNQAVHYEGSDGSAFGVQSVNGISISGWGLGLGVGLDLYRMRSYPVFVHLQRSVPVRRVPLFIYADGGPNFAWARKTDLVAMNNGQVKHGYYWDAGLQYHAPLRNKTALVFSVGYSEKTYSESYSYPGWCAGGNCPQMNNALGYKLRRIALKAGFHF